MARALQRGVREPPTLSARGSSAQVGGQGVLVPGQVFVSLTSRGRSWANNDNKNGRSPSRLDAQEWEESLLDGLPAEAWWVVSTKGPPTQAPSNLGEILAQMNSPTGRESEGGKRLRVHAQHRAAPTGVLPSDTSPPAAPATSLRFPFQCLFPASGLIPGQWRTKMAASGHQQGPTMDRARTRPGPFRLSHREIRALQSLVVGWRGRGEHQVIRTIKAPPSPTQPHRGPQESKWSAGGVGLAGTQASLPTWTYRPPATLTLGGFEGDHPNLSLPPSSGGEPGARERAANREDIRQAAFCFVFCIVV